MKKILLIVAIFLVVVTLAFAIVNVSASKTVDEKVKIEKFAKMKKDFGIDAKESTESPKIDEKKAIEIAKKVSGNTALNAKNVSCYYTVMTCPQLATASIQPDALEANPKLKEKDYLSETPVWVITFEGVNVKGPHNAVFADDNVVIDATTGNFLFGFQ